MNAIRAGLFFMGLHGVLHRTPPITTTTTTTNNNNNNKNANKNSFIDPVYGIPGLPILKLSRFYFFLFA